MARDGCDSTPSPPEIEPPKFLPKRIESIQKDKDKEEVEGSSEIQRIPDLEISDISAPIASGSFKTVCRVRWLKVEEYVALVTYNI
jgi:hypothetical protein